MPRPIDIPHIDDLIRRYMAGESAEQIAGGIPVSRATLIRRFRARGVDIRQGPSYRTTDTDESKAARALTRQARRLHASPDEAVLAKMLADLDVEVIPQLAIGPYNVDLALTEAPVAVEVVGGGYQSRKYTRRRERIEYVLDAGWWLIEVFTRAGPGTAPLTIAAAQYIIATAEQLCGQPALRGQHRMVWADGKTYAARSRQVD